jgi:SAM-dependent methyltransferase
MPAPLARAAFRQWLARAGLLEPSRRLRQRLRQPWRLIQRRLGIAPRHVQQTPDYWEARGRSYIEEVRPIYSDPANPHFQAQRELLAELRAMEWTSLLEVGCGFGWHLRALAEEHPGRQLAGVDFSLSQLAQGRGYLQGLGVPLARADAARLPFADGAFDVVLTSGTLIYMHPRQLPAVLRELARVARRSVVLLEYAREDMDTPARRALMDGAAWHGHRYGAELAALGLPVAKHFTLRAYAAHPDTVPLSFFHVVRPCDR